MGVIKEKDSGIVRRARLVDDAGEPVGPACRFLSHLGDREFSPNTLAAYAYDLKYLFTFLEREELDWQDFRAPHMLSLLAFLRQVPSRRAAQRLGLAVVARPRGLRPLHPPRHRDGGDRLGSRHQRAGRGRAP